MSCNWPFLNISSLWIGDRCERSMAYSMREAISCVSFQDAGIAYPSGAPGFIPIFSGVRVARSLVFCVMFRRSLFVRLSFYIWTLCCLSFDIRLLITPLVSSNSSCVFDSSSQFSWRRYWWENTPQWSI